ncbi:hypothetical protein [Pseudobacteriovorax antillogorgiicola]|uniref:Uncharacterized protein n=1 Tax=Pseudobacteriovorax antillogorgiicola TaxID=1513793 RepID=A0A1Y6BG03_9BACT|nr:hypothetical protein [Pseudobacteriovorax antillogorgiicola]TCS56253.1 hypothetical protein EDD56_10475 [Pseudobacteriovorax antillogorgiicola]SMF07972.1 hypothetical protein SAMN06296036_104258 [Pseudobacteriovorax antillogorgiicola]
MNDLSAILERSALGKDFFCQSTEKIAKGSIESLWRNCVMKCGLTSNSVFSCLHVIGETCSLLETFVPVTTKKAYQRKDACGGGAILLLRHLIRRLLGILS